jgi:hypothetical protein
LGCWISPHYGPFLLGAHFVTYEPFISSIFKFFSGRSTPRITETIDTESADTGAHMYSQNLLIQQLFDQEQRLDRRELPRRKLKFKFKGKRLRG